MTSRFFPGVLVAALLLVSCASADMRLVNRGYEAIDRGKLVEAEQHLEAALEINPDNPYILLNMGYVLHHTGRYDEAREMYQKLVVLSVDEKPDKVLVESLEGYSFAELAQHNLAMLPAVGTELPQRRVAGR